MVSAFHRQGERRYTPSTQKNHHEKKEYVKKTEETISKLLTKWIEHINEGFSPGVASVKAGFRWEDWRLVVLKDPAAKECYEKYIKMKNDQKRLRSRKS